MRKVHSVRCVRDEKDVLSVMQSMLCICDKMKV